MKVRDRSRILSLLEDVQLHFQRGQAPPYLTQSEIPAQDWVQELQNRYSEISKEFFDKVVALAHEMAGKLEQARKDLMNSEERRDL